VLIDASPPALRRRSPKWLWIATGLIAAGFAVAIALLALNWPFTQSSITAALEQASGRQVKIRAFHNSYIPMGCTAEGIQFLRHKHPELQPVITIEKLTIRSSLFGLFGRTKRISSVQISAMHMIVPPAEERSSGKPVYLNAGPGGTSLAISKITADSALLEFMRYPHDPSPYILRIVHLEVSGVGPRTAMDYRATLDNTEPPGAIRAEGSFGPWNPDNVGATPLSGRYTYDKIDLSRFSGIEGTGRANGEFSGRLSNIETHGRVDVSGFGIQGTGHSVNVSTTFEAMVDGTNGDVQLNPAVAHFRHTQIEVRGRIASTAGDQGKTAQFGVSVPRGRVDDLLYLFDKGDPDMQGDVALNGTFLWPPGPATFLRKIRMRLIVGIRASKFSSPNTQDSIDRLSESAAGERRKEQKEDGRVVLSQVEGNIDMRNGIAAVTNGHFHVPGADATLHGAYSPLNRRVDLHGALATKGTLADTTSGLKAVFAKVVTPLFPKRGDERIIPFDITGAGGNAKVAIDWKRDLARVK
jgi:hypothetical protein